MSWANDYVGIPWRWRGRSRWRGLDCYGLVRLVYADRLNVVLPEQQYLSTADAVACVRTQKANWSAVDEPEPFDVGIVETFAVDPATFRMARNAHHLVICVDAETVLDAKDPVGVVTGPHPKRVVEWLRSEIWT